METEREKRGSKVVREQLGEGINLGSEGSFLHWGRRERIKDEYEGSKMGGLKLRGFSSDGHHCLEKWEH